MTKFTKLRIKRLTLAHEARLIRQAELKARGTMRFLSTMTEEKTDKRIAKMGLTDSQMRRVKRNRDRAKANAPVYQQADAFTLYLSLRAHRIWIVREAARSAHIALAYLKGKPYTSVEQVGAIAAQGGVQAARRLTAIAKDVRTFGGPTETGCTPKDIDYWMGGGMTLAQEAELEEAGEDGISSKLAEA